MARSGDLPVVVVRSFNLIGPGQGVQTVAGALLEQVRALRGGERHPDSVEAGDRLGATTDSRGEPVGHARRMRSPTAVFVSTAANQLMSSMPILEFLAASGWRVIGVTWADYQFEEVKGAGVDIRYLKMSRRIFEPLTHLRTLVALYRLYREERPDLTCHLSINPTLYGMLAARLAHVPARVGLLLGFGGSVVTSDRWDAPLLRTWIRAIAKVALGGRGVRVLLRNDDDLEVAHQRIMIPRDRLAVIGGGGVDLDRFAPRPELEGLPVALFAGRIMMTKGLHDLAEASRILHERGCPLEIRVAGFVDDVAVGSVPERQVREWEREDLMTWLGRRDDLPDLLAHSHIAVLPSYREGISRFLMEAAAVGRPIVTTNVPGCRDVVRHEWNGLLVEPRDPVGLADALERLAGDVELRKLMGRRSRILAERQFGYDSVIRRHVEVYADLLPGCFETPVEVEVEVEIDGPHASVFGGDT